MSSPVYAPSTLAVLSKSMTGRRIQMGIGKFLIAAGLILLLFVAFQLWGTGLETSNGQNKLESKFSKAYGKELDISESTSAEELFTALKDIDPKTAPEIPAAADGAPVGAIRIEKIGLAMWMVENVEKEQLKLGPGHYPSTPLPGQHGNAAVAGHRTTYKAPFNRIDELVAGDKIQIATTQGLFTYEVMKPVIPEGVEVIESGESKGQAWFTVRPNTNGGLVLANKRIPDPNDPTKQIVAEDQPDMLTLTACHPKYSAKQRIVVQAKLVSDLSPVVQAVSTKDIESSSQKIEDSLAGDPAEKWPALWFGLAALFVWILVIIIGKIWMKWPAYLLGVVPFFFLLFLCFEHVNRFIPAV